MPARSIWKGSLTFGLVNIPVGVYSIARSERPRLNQVCSRDHAPIQYKRWCPKEEREVPYDEIIYGLRVGSEVISVSQEELRTVSTRKENEIEVVQFVGADEVPPVYFDRPYALLPQEKMSAKSFALFLDTIRRSGKAAVGRVVLRNKEHLALIYVYEGLLILETLRFQSDLHLVDPPALGVELSKEERALATQLVERLEDRFDPTKFKDETSERLAALLETKGTRSAVPEVGPGGRARGATKAQELVDVLKQSVKARRKRLNAHDRKHGLPHARVPLEAV
jgi:DNA end-binding protein Ku